MIRRVGLGTVTLAVEDWGRGDAPAVLALHGFPELGRYWQPLATAMPDMRWLMPDLRGYGASTRPADPEAYDTETLVADVIGLLDALGLSQVHLVGHDFGGLLAWWVAEQHPGRVTSLAVFNAPHPAALQARLIDDPVQREASAYFNRLQHPTAGRALLAEGAAAFWTRLRGQPAAGFEADADRAAWLEAWGQFDALDGAVAWYRCTPLRRPERVGDASITWHLGPRPPVEPPTLIVWGEGDTTFNPQLAQDSAQRCSRVSVQRLPGVRHNPPREATAACKALLANFWKSLLTHS